MINASQAKEIRMRDKDYLNELKEIINEIDKSISVASKLCWCQVKIDISERKNEQSLTSDITQILKENGFKTHVERDHHLGRNLLIINW